MQLKTGKIIAVLVVFAVLVGFVTISKRIARADTEPNDTFDQAELITPGTYTGAVDDTTDPDDYYKITVSAGQTIDANVTPASTLRVWLRLYNPAPDLMIDDFPDQGVVAKVSWTTNSEQASYTYYVLVEAGTGYGTYSMTVSLVSQNDGNSGGDAGDIIDTATQLTSTTATYLGLLRDLDVDDYYKLTVMAGQTLAVNVTPTPSLGLWLGLYDPAGNEVSSDSPDAGVVAKVSWTANSAQASYTYYVLVEAWTGFGNYSMAVAAVSQNDAGSGGDAGDTLDTATPVATGTFYGFMKDDDVDDCYRLVQNVTAGQGLYVTVIPSALQVVEVILYDEGKNQQASGTAYPGVAVTVNVRAAMTRVFYIKVALAEEHGNYTMRISTEPIVGVPAHKPTTPNVGESVTVSVGVTAGQNGTGTVILSYSTNGVSWANVTMLLNATTFLYEGTIPGFQSVTTVYYKVTAYDTAGDYFVQDNTGLYYTYQVIPEFSTLTMMLFLVCLSAPLAILLRRRTRH